jgi:hypothetical protein
MSTDLRSISPRDIRPAHEVRDADKLAALAAAMDAAGWDGRAILAYDYCGAICAVTGSHRIAAARAADLEEIPVLVMSDEMVTIDGEEMSSSDVLRATTDLTTLVDVLAMIGADDDALALAVAEVTA